MLEHDSYDFSPAQPALSWLNQQQIPLVLNTSKTLSEVLRWRAALDNHWPFVVENGSALLLPERHATGLELSQFERIATDAGEPLLIHYFGQAYSELCAPLYQLRSQLNLRFRGFSEMTAAQVVELTGLSEEQAQLAQQRLSSEPIQWQDTPQALMRLRYALSAHGLHIVQGGRFLHVMSKVDKALGVRWLMKLFDRQYTAPLTSIALGDSPNDLGMLQAADIAVAIPSVHAKALALRHHPRLYRPTATGPTGWLQAIEQIFACSFHANAQSPAKQKQADRSSS